MQASYKYCLLALASNSYSKLIIGSLPGQVCVCVCVCVLVTQLCPTLCNPMDWGLPGSSVHGILQARILEGSQSLLQEIFPAQGSNWGLLHCKRILYQLSYQRSPRDTGQGTNLWSSLLTYQFQHLGFDFNGIFCSFRKYIDKIANGIQQILNLLQVLF